MVPGTAFLHACRYLDSRGAPTPHLRTPHAGAARTYPHPACTQKVPGNKVFRIWQAGALDSGNKIAASAHGMGSGGLAVDAMAIGCLGVERRVERFFSYLAIFTPEYNFNNRKPSQITFLFFILNIYKYIYIYIFIVL